MNWALAIDRNRAALLAVVAAIAALIGGREDGRIARCVRSAALALLRPAESAVRRLIVIAARGLRATVRPPRPLILEGQPATDETPTVLILRSPQSGRLEGRTTVVRASRRGLRPLLSMRRTEFAITGRTPGLSKDAIDRMAAASRAGDRPRAFPLFDRRKRFGRLLPVVAPRGVPRIRTFWGAQPAAVVATPPPVAAHADPDSLIDAGRLRLRLRSLEAALADLPRQARRLARWRARRKASPERQPSSPLRLGHPPGHRQRPTHDIDEVLRDCHALALDALMPDTS